MPVLLSLLRFFLYQNLRSIIFLAFSLFTTSCNHSRSVNSIALPFSLPFAQMKTYCYLAERRCRFQILEQLSKGLYYCHPVDLFCKTTTLLDFGQFQVWDKCESHVHFHSHSSTPTNSTPALQPHCFAAMFENELLACSPVHLVHK